MIQDHNDKILCCLNKKERKNQHFGNNSITMKIMCMYFKNWAKICPKGLAPAPTNIYVVSVGISD